MRRLYPKGFRSADDLAIIRRILSPRRIIVPLLVVLALARLPGTGWLIRSHFHVLTDHTLPVHGSGLSESSDPSFDYLTAGGGKSFLTTPALAKLVQNCPDDYQVQVGAALLQPGAGEGPVNIQVKVIRDLESRFSGRPALRAHEIAAIVGQCTIPKLEEDWLLSGDAPPSAKAGPAGVDMAGLGRAAARGEEMDADNAFFPMITAYCLFAEHRDREAMDAVLRAGQKNRWDSYFQDSARAAVGLTPRLEGRVPSARRFAIFEISTEAQEPLVGLIRTVSRAAVWNAILNEQHGGRDAELRYRAAIMGVGSRMRVQSPSLIENLVGVSLVRVCLVRPGGAPTEPRRPKVDTEIALQQRLDRYCDYLQRTGHASDVLWVRTEMNRGAVVHEITNCALKTTSWLKPFIASLVTWILSFSLFVCFVSTAAGMILGSLIPKSWRLKRRRAPLRARQLRGIRFIFGFFVLLIYLYPILVLYAAHVDTQASQAFDRMLTYEGSYVAASVHREWPGPPDASAGRQP